jgi:hypothetical protein
MQMKSPAFSVAGLFAFPMERVQGRIPDGTGYN